MWEPGFKFTRQWRQEYKINRLYLGAVKRYYPPPDTTQILCQSYLADTVFRIFTLSSPEPLGLIFVTDEWSRYQKKRWAPGTRMGFVKKRCQTFRADIRMGIDTWENFRIVFH